MKNTFIILWGGTHGHFFLSRFPLAEVARLSRVGQVHNFLLSESTKSKSRRRRGYRRGALYDTEYLFIANIMRHTQLRAFRYNSAEYN